MSARDHDKLLDLLNQTQEYLSQQKELFGDDAFEGVKQPSRLNGAAAAGKNDADISPTMQIPTVKKAPASKGGPAGIKPVTGPKAAPSPFAYPDETWVKTESLADLNTAICNCLKCALGATRTKFVFGVGDPNADVMFIGEGPGADEDAKGEPFVGRAGQLLNKIIEATGMKREQVYICNIVKCRPPNNRAPLPAEEEVCTPYLMKQIELVKPKFIICLGRTAAQWLLQTADGLSAMRGRMHDFHGAKLIVTYHPAALLRNPEWKKPTWEDLKMFMTAYEATRGI